MVPSISTRIPANLSISGGPMKAGVSSSHCMMMMMLRTSLSKGLTVDVKRKRLNLVGKVY